MNFSISFYFKMFYKNSIYDTRFCVQKKIQKKLQKFESTNNCEIFND